MWGYRAVLIGLMCMICVAAKPGAVSYYASPDCYTYDLTGVVRYQEPLHVVHLNPVNGAGLDEGYVIDVVRRVMREWDDATPWPLFDELVVDYSAVAEGDESSRDGVSEIGFNNTLVGIPNVAPYSAKTFMQWTGKPEERGIVEFSVSINGSPGLWSSQGEVGYYDFENEMTRIVGWVAGLELVQYDHCSDVSMYYRTSKGEVVKRGLAWGDVLGVRAVYGE